MKGFILLLVISASVKAKKPAYAPAKDKSDTDEAETLRKARNNLLDKITQLQEENDNLRLNNMALDALVDSGMNRMNFNLSDTQPRDCADLLMYGVKRSGIYTIYPFSCVCPSPMRVYCDMETDGGGWTVIMDRRQQVTQLNFNRSWTDYKNGFGHPYSEHWLGNDNIHTLTFSRSYSLRMDYKTTSGDSKAVIYSTFQLGNEELRYKLLLAARATESTNTYDCFYYNRNRYFTTYDKDFDAHRDFNCAAKTGGGFWYHDCRTHSPPTGVYQGALNNTCYSATVYQLSSLQMKIRPSVCGSTYRRINFVNTGCGDCGSPVPV